MKFSSTFVVAICSAVAIASAKPMWASNTGATKMMCQSTNPNALGAAYWITNHPDGNMVMAATIGSDGSLSMDRAVATGGKGLHGNSTGVDGLFSQNGIVASQTGQVLATVNPGSNTLSLFSIDPKTPSNITPLGYPISSEGEFPMSVVFNKDGSMLCTLNGGTVAGVNCYKVDKETGLTTMPNTLRYLTLNQTYPPTGPPGTASQIAFNHDESKLVVSVKGSPPASVGFIATWDIATDKSLSAAPTMITPPTGAGLPFSLTPIPGQNAFFMADPAVGALVIDMADESKSVAVPIAKQIANCWSTHSSKTGSYYLMDPGRNVVTEFSLSASLNASVVNSYQLGMSDGIIDGNVATINDKDYLYVIAPNATSVEVLALNGAGNAKHTMTLDFASTAHRYGVPIIPDNLQGMAVFVLQ